MRVCEWCPASIDHRSPKAKRCGRPACEQTYRRAYYRDNRAHLRAYQNKRRRKPKMTRQCVGCETVFETSYPHKRWCTTACRTSQKGKP